MSDSFWCSPSQVRQYRVTQLLRTVDGVGPLTSLAFVLELNSGLRPSPIC